MFSIVHKKSTLNFLTIVLKPQKHEPPIHNICVFVHTCLLVYVYVGMYLPSA